MAVRKAIIRTIPRGETEPRVVIGRLIDDGTSEPYGTNPQADSMLLADRRARFETYYRGYSNGYTFETLPDFAVSNPAEWSAWLQDRGESFEDLAARLQRGKAA